jgi:hypothetical protein
MRLKTLRRSHRPEKKYDAVFLTPDGNEKTVPFGQRGYNDFIIYNKKSGETIANKRKQLYIQRHSGMGEHWSKPDTPGALSRWILWNKKTLKASLKDFKRKFKV